MFHDVSYLHLLLTPGLVAFSLSGRGSRAQPSCVYWDVEHTHAMAGCLLSYSGLVRDGRYARVSQEVRGPVDLSPAAKLE
jgi:hypothetical protein